MPIAYLHLCTYDGTEARPIPKIQSKLELRHYGMSSTRGLKPVFVLLDKDSGEISAVSEAWSWTANIQLCYWHLEHAIYRRIKDKKSNTIMYTETKASEANRIFNFIDPSWIMRDNDNNSLWCPDESVKEPLDIVESTVMGEQITIDSVRDLATCRKCVAQFVVTNRSQTVSDL